MGCYLTSWFSKKQTALAISTIEYKYVSARKAHHQVLWMKQALVDYDINLDDIPVLCDNKGVIELSKNPVLHSRTKHIEIRHHFLRDNIQKGNISIEKVSSEDNIADILTKPLKRESFNLLRLGSGGRRGVKEKNKVVTAMDVAVSPSVIDEPVVKEKQSLLVDISIPNVERTGLSLYPPLPTHGSTPAGNTPSMSSYANVIGEPSRKALNFRTLFTPGETGLM
ncbi:hypothetical protein Tco_1546843 [Tanacetum coccineum]